MRNRYDILEYIISQRKDGEMPEENERLVYLSNVINEQLRTAEQMKQNMAVSM